MAARDSPAQAKVVSDLEQRGFYERYFALFSCYGSYDGAHVCRALADPSRTIRGLALTLVPLCCDDTQAVQALELLAPPDRRRLAKRLRRAHRLDPIDTFIRQLADEDNPTLSDLLPYGSITTVTACVEQVLDSAAIRFWTRLARQHPELAALVLGGRITSSVDENTRLLWQVNNALPYLVETSTAWRK